jgi:hypothetical protein
LKLSYINIDDNLAPTDNGKVYGIGLKYKIASLDYYRSDYDSFDVNQYDLILQKGFKVDNFTIKPSLMLKAISIDGDKYGTYRFSDKDYFAYGASLSVGYNDYFGAISTLLGKRVFTTLENGTKVQHHAMEQKRAIGVAIGKKIDK